MPAARTIFQLFRVGFMFTPGMVGCWSCGGWSCAGGEMHRSGREQGSGVCNQGRDGVTPTRLLDPERAGRQSDEDCGGCDVELTAVVPHWALPANVIGVVRDPGTMFGQRDRPVPQKSQQVGSFLER